ncbi:MAG: glycosyltransferase family 2 protein [Burkholderiales bacterium]|nr:glycosyltransferase family 2 protein [Burkholderiales bacterium]
MSVSVSIVSHGHAALVLQLLDDLAALGSTGLDVILTINVPEPLKLSVERYPFSLRVVRNVHRKGFGANHNAAFRLAEKPFFAVVNPDIRLRADVLPSLCAAAARPGVGVVAPLVLSPTGAVEDSARRFPTPGSLARKLLFAGRDAEHPTTGGHATPDWVAGMFMVFARETFAAIKGFDERYFLYYEDVDLCWRLRRAGFDVQLVRSVAVMHDARRASHRNMHHMRMHLAGMARFMITSRFGLGRP